MSARTAARGARRRVVVLAAALVPIAPRAARAQPCAPTMVWAPAPDDGSAHPPMRLWLRLAPDATGCDEAGRLRVVTDHPMDFSVARARFAADTAYFESAAAGGLRFAGRLDAAGTSVHGVFTGGGRSIPVVLHRAGGPLAVVDTALLTGGPASSVRWPIPAGWSAEGFVLPLVFERDAPYRGAEITRFAPGFSRPEAPGYWTYAFAMLLDGGLTDAPRDAPALEALLRGYYRGFAVSMQAPPARVDSVTRVTLASEASTVGTPAWARFAGHGTVVDPFGGGATLPIALTVRVRSCTGKARTVVVVGVRPETGATATALAALIDRFDC